MHRRIDSSAQSKMMHFIYCWLVVCLMQCKFSEPSATAQPEASITSQLVYNAFLNSQKPGTFACITRNSDDIRWIVAGSAHNAPYIKYTRQIRVYTSSQNRSQHSVIVIPAISFNKHIPNIKCRAYNITENSIESADSIETARFNVQGLLEMPPNITYSSYNISHNLIEWLEPETLNITNVEPDIENYTICTNVTDECLNTTTTHFILPKYFVDIVINVTAWNIVGESNSFAQLLVEACSADGLETTTGQEIFLDVSFDLDSNTILYITFANESRNSLPSAKKCPYLYEVTVYQRNDQFTVTRQVYGFQHSVVLKVPLTRNRLYTANVTRITAHYSLNQVDFNTSDIRNVSIIQDGNALHVACNLVVGATVTHFTVQLLTKENELLVERNFSVDEECGGALHTQPCSVHTSVDLPLIIGNLTVAILAWEESSVVHKVYSKEFVVNVNSTVGSEVTKENSTSLYTQQDLLITTVGGGALGLCFVVFLSALTLRAIIKRQSIRKLRSRAGGKHSIYLGSTNPLAIPNEAYSTVLEMSQNDAYGTALKDQACDANEPHLYDEIPPPAACFKNNTNIYSEPVYAEVTTID